MSRPLDHRNYELSNHLGNVLAVISDRKYGEDSDTDGELEWYKPNVLSETDYYAFGSEVNERSVSGGYKFGFNGKENDKETGTQDYGMRNYSPFIGRPISIDPLSTKYPSLSPYQFFSNSPIANIDLDGGEAKISIKTEYIKDGKSLGMRIKTVDYSVVMGVHYGPEGVHGTLVSNYTYNVNSKSLEHCNTEYQTTFSEEMQKIGESMDKAGSKIKGNHCEATNPPFKSVEAGLKGKAKYGLGEVIIDAKSKGMTENHSEKSLTTKVNGLFSSTSKTNTKSIDLEGNAYLKFIINDQTTPAEGSIKGTFEEFYGQINYGVNGITSVEFGLTTKAKVDFEISGNAKVTILKSEKKVK